MSMDTPTFEACIVFAQGFSALREGHSRGVTRSTLRLSRPSTALPTINPPLAHFLVLSQAKLVLALASVLTCSSDELVPSATPRSTADGRGIQMHIFFLCTLVSMSSAAKRVNVEAMVLMSGGELVQFGFAKCPSTNSWKGFFETFVFPQATSRLSAFSVQLDLSCSYWTFTAQRCS